MKIYIYMKIYEDIYIFSKDPRLNTSIFRTFLIFNLWSYMRVS